MIGMKHGPERRHGSLQSRIEQALARLCADERIELRDVSRAIRELEKRNGEWDEPKK